MCRTNPRGRRQAMGIEPPSVIHGSLGAHSAQTPTYVPRSARRAPEVGPTAPSQENPDPRAFGGHVGRTKGKQNPTRREGECSPQVTAVIVVPYCLLWLKNTDGFVGIVTFHSSPKLQGVGGTPLAKRTFVGFLFTLTTSSQSHAAELMIPTIWLLLVKCAIGPN